jgi:hypothetical protein
MAKPPAEKVRDTESRKRARGLREIRVWVPDRDKYGPEPEGRVREVAADEVAKIETKE